MYDIFSAYCLVPVSPLCCPAVMAFRDWLGVYVDAIETQSMTSIYVCIISRLELLNRRLLVLTCAPSHTQPSCACILYEFYVQDQLSTSSDVLSCKGLNYVADLRIRPTRYDTPTYAWSHVQCPQHQQSLTITAQASRQIGWQPIPYAARSCAIYSCICVSLQLRSFLLETLVSVCAK